MKTAAARFSALAAARSTVLENARTAARVTIPGLIPLEGQNEHYTPTQPYQSVGADGVRSLSARLLMTLFPTNVGFFRLNVDAAVAQFTGEEKNAVDVQLAQFAQSANNLLDDRRARAVLAEVLRHLVIAGNVLLHIPLKDTPRIYRLDQYVVKRDSRGVPILIIARESVHVSTLSAETRTAVGLTLDPEKDQTVDVYTVIEKRGENHAQYQEINGKRVPGSESETPIEKSGWLALRWLAIPANDYGRSHVTEYIGDLLALEELNESMIAYTAITSDIKFFVQPNSVIDLDVVVGSERGSFHTGEAKDISVLSLDKQADFMVAERLASAIEARVAKAFLIQQFRNAERVTAEEIRMSSEELENTLGGTYSVLSAELQYAVATRYLYIAEREDLIPTLPAGIKPKVITGLAALGAAAEVNRVRTWASDVMSLLGQAEFIAKVDTTALMNKLGVEHGVTDLQSLLKSPEQIEAEQQQAMMAQATQAAAPGFMDAAMKAASQNPNQGTE
ncbi:portal protein [Brevundimonas sp. C43]|uniref:portal protein n=1 Tax=Brevundimonas sp. C43 TaxID=3068314 RepID=UPI00273F5EE1|nr:portal protein [Brevundimonas sp. C43]